MMHLLSFILVSEPEVCFGDGVVLTRRQGIYIFRTYVRVSESIEHVKKHSEKLRR